jgi:type IV pilus assembly protein PilE
MITVVIVGILAAVAFPSYTDFVARSNRSEAQRELLRIANLQEQYFVDNRSYTVTLTKLGLDKDAFITENDYYEIKAKLENGGFTLTATALEPQKSRDSSCLTLSVTDTGKKTPDNACWEQ